MHEYAVKLEQKEGTTQTQQEEMEFHEEKYNRLMTDLTELKAARHQKTNEIALKKQEQSHELEKLNHEIERLRRDKDHLINKQQLFRKDEEDKTRRIEHLLSDLGKYEKMIKKMQESYMQKEHDYTVCEQRMQEIQEKALQQQDFDNDRKDRVNSRLYSMNESIASSKKSAKINEDEEEGSEQNEQGA